MTHFACLAQGYDVHRLSVARRNIHDEHTHARHNRFSNWRVAFPILLAVISLTFTHVCPLPLNGESIILFFAILFLLSLIIFCILYLALPDARRNGAENGVGR